MSKHPQWGPDVRTFQAAVWSEGCARLERECIIFSVRQEDLVERQAPWMCVTELTGPACSFGVLPPEAIPPDRLESEWPFRYREACGAT